MCIFHKWTKWTPYTEKGTYYGALIKGPVTYTTRRQKRQCKKCGKEEDIAVC